LQKSVATTVKGHPCGPITQSKEAVKALLTWRAGHVIHCLSLWRWAKERTVWCWSCRIRKMSITLPQPGPAPAQLILFLMAIHANTRGSTFLWLCRRPERSQAASGQKLGGSAQMDKRQMALWRLKDHEKLSELWMSTHHQKAG